MLTYAAENADMKHILLLPLSLLSQLPVAASPPMLRAQVNRDNRLARASVSTAVTAPLFQWRPGGGGGGGSGSGGSDAGGSSGEAGAAFGPSWGVA